MTGKNSYAYMQTDKQKTNRQTETIAKNRKIATNILFETWSISQKIKHSKWFPFEHFKNWNATKQKHHYRDDIVTNENCAHHIDCGWHLAKYTFH